MEERSHKKHHHQVSDPTPLSMNNSGTPEGELRVSTHRGSPNLPDHHGVKDAKVQDTSLQVTKEWMALWLVDHAAHVDTSKSPRTAPTCRLGGRT